MPAKSQRRSDQNLASSVFTFPKCPNEWLLRLLGQNFNYRTSILSTGFPCVGVPTSRKPRNTGLHHSVQRCSRHHRRPGHHHHVCYRWNFEPREWRNICWPQVLLTAEVQKEQTRLWFRFLNVIMEDKPDICVTVEGYEGWQTLSTL